MLRPRTRRRLRRTGRVRLELRPPRPDFIWREIHWPAALAPEFALAVLRQLATDHFVGGIALEVEATAGLVAYGVGVPAESVSRVEQLLAALVPDSAITIARAREELTEAWR